MNKNNASQLIDSCCFCQEITSQKMPENFRQKSSYETRIFEEDDNYIAIPTISPITEGHILILPKRHLNSISQIESIKHKNFLSFTEKIISLINSKYGQTIFFEHGIGKNKEGGCGVSHAHLHIMPIGSEEICKIKEDISKNYNIKFMNDIKMLFQINHDESYLLFGHSFEKLFCYIGDDIPSQYLRRIITKHKNLHRFDWKELFNWDIFNSTLASLNSGKNISFDVV